MSQNIDGLEFFFLFYLSCFSRVAPSVGYTLLYMEAQRVQ